MRIEAGVSVPTEGNSNNSANIESHSSAAWMKKKIQPFAEDKDDIGDYLKRFEIKLAKFNVQEKEWSEILLDLLHGKALTICQNHDHSMQNSYQVLKKELLNAYGHNAATFRKKYYENTPSSQVDPQTTINSEKDFFTKWLGFENVENTYEGLRNFILIDNFLNKCDLHLQSFVKERNPKVLDEVTEIIRTYKKAYPSNPLSNKDKKNIDLVGYTQENKDRGRSRGREPQPVRGNSNSGRAKGVTCYTCGRKGHIAVNCMRSQSRSSGRNNYSNRSGYNNYSNNRNKENRSKSREQQPRGVDRVYFVKGNSDSFTFYPGFINKRPVRAVRDSGCNTIVIRSNFIEPQDYRGYQRKVEFADGSIKEFEAVRVFIETPFYTGYCEGVAMPEMRQDMLIGNIPGVKECTTEELAAWQNKYKQMNQSTDTTPYESNMVMTRAEGIRKAEAQENSIESGSTETMEQPRGNGLENNQVAETNENDSRKEEQEDLEETKEIPRFAQEQKLDNIVGSIYARVEDKNNNNPMEKFKFENDILVRQTILNGRKVKQLVLPQKYWQDALVIVHDNNMSAHSGTKKCFKNLSRHFFWPNMKTTIAKYIGSCDICQKKEAKGRMGKAPLQAMDEPTEPFQKIAIDIIGPLTKTESNSRYILTIIDMFTRYPEAVALSNIDTENIINGLTQKWITRYGMPKILLTDNASQFRSEQFKKWMEQSGMRHMTSSVYHAEGNGTCEWFNGGLKRALAKIVQNNQSHWDRYINFVLFAHRNNVHEATQFSPYELVYGRKPRDEIQIFKESFITNVIETEEDEAVLDLKQIWKEAYDNCSRYKHNTRERVNEKRQIRTLEIGDKVLILVNDLKNKIGKQRKGPYTITDKTSAVKYKVDINGKVRTHHINNLKRYMERDREETHGEHMEAENNGEKTEECLLVLIEEENKDNDIKDIPLLEVNKNQTWEQLNLENLSQEKARDIQNMVYEFKEMFSS
ncbi:uncharacterized protein LOC129925304 [Biomphalaria glabrata]|uniref:Uncharacterized protein LOC129925304 n=1 Tax=Biomphalaria glabrata TaxID=6526 RepID=A0A9W3A0J8_BIOGL|nr:uncharacterized protein LOC129925304 [Biomphalaria glabrata]